jgi:anti-sigma regulatory factor (Ser/Thr protein kinase)
VTGYLRAAFESRFITADRGIRTVVPTERARPQDADDTARGRQFTHTAVIVESDFTLREELAREIRRSVSGGTPVLMAVSDHTADVVRNTLSDVADGLHWAERGRYDQRMGFAYEWFRRYLADQHSAGHQVHVIAEPEISAYPGPDPPVDRVAAYLCYESICNTAFAAYGAQVTCLWDSRWYPTIVLEDARSVHPHELTGAGRVRNPAYIGPTDYLAARNDVPGPAPPTPVDLDVPVEHSGVLPLLRRALKPWAEQRGFGPRAIADILLAATEVATNGLIHGGDPVRIRAWDHEQTLVVQVDDGGRALLPPAAGYVFPDPGTGKRGMWLARQLADVVTVDTTAGHNAVRLHFPYDLTHRRPEDMP